MRVSFKFIQEPEHCLQVPALLRGSHALSTGVGGTCVDKGAPLGRETLEKTLVHTVGCMETMLEVYRFGNKNRVPWPFFDRSDDIFERINCLETNKLMTS